MKKKYILAAFALGLSISAKVMAQVPSYVPVNGLVAFYPFSGNANDVSVNGNNGTVSGATLTSDRLGVSSNAYSFDGSNDFIKIDNNLISSSPESFTISFWVNSNSNLDGALINDRPNTNYGYKYMIAINQLRFTMANETNCAVNNTFNNQNLQLNNWYHIVVVFDYLLQQRKTYINNILVENDFGYCWPNNFCSTYIGASIAPGSMGMFFNGKIDDIAIYNRDLTQQEITTLYNGCTGNEITTQPINSVNTLGSNAQFSVNAVAGSTFQWQSNPLNTGWLNLSNNSTYSGATTNTLTVSNTTVSNHNQPFRAIVNTGGCIDTSSVAQIIIGDTCLTTVTDTLIINTTLGLPAPNNENTILIYPNPASDHITIDNGNYSAMAGYTIKIENNAGQQVFQSLINQAQFYVDLSTWSGNGLYFVHLIDAQGNTVTVRKIILQ